MIASDLVSHMWQRVAESEKLLPSPVTARNVEYKMIFPLIPPPRCRRLDQNRPRGLACDIEFALVAPQQRGRIARGRRSQYSAGV
jgi:hypothetical protein